MIVEYKITLYVTRPVDPADDIVDYLSAEAQRELAKEVLAVLHARHAGTAWRLFNGECDGEVMSAVMKEE